MARVCYRGRRYNTFRRIDRKNSTTTTICNNKVVIIKKCPSVKAKKPASLNFEDEYYPQVQAFVEEPVSFDFGDADYGNQMFDDSHREQAWDNFNRLAYHWGSHQGIHQILHGLKQDLIDSFLKSGDPICPVVDGFPSYEIDYPGSKF